MNLFDTPWVVGLMILVFLLALSIREFILSLRIPTHLHERGIGFFHSFILAVFFIGGVFGMRVLYLHASSLSEIIPLYPSARYAPEREAFEDKGTWVFVSLDSRDQIMKYYLIESTKGGYRFSSDRSSTSDRFYLSKGDTHMFITVVDEPKSRILYYSFSGEVVVETIPN